MSEEHPEDWKYLLRGGFAFQNAPFASHPHDIRRAREMLSMARSEGIAPHEIVDEAHRYLQSATGLDAISIDDQLRRVRNFLRSED